MKEAEYGVGKRDIVHRAVSLSVLVVLTCIMFLGGDGGISWRLLGAYVFGTALIWFPETFAACESGYKTELYFRLLGWLILVLVPICIYIVRSIAN